MMFFMLLFAIVLIGAVTFYLLMLVAESSPRAQSVEGTLADLPEYIAGLMTAAASVEPEENDYFLVGTINATDDFLQFTADGGEVLLDFPLITDRQKECEDKVKAVCRGVGIKPAAYIHSNPDKIGADYGENHLAYVINGTAEEVSSIIAEIYKGIFEIDSTTAMNFEKNGF